MSDLLKELNALASLAAAATEGPWEAYTDYTGWDGDPDTVANPYETLVLGPSWSAQVGPNEWEGGSGPFICTTGVDPQEGAPDADVPNAEANAAFIAAARNLLTPANLTTLAAALAAPAAVVGGGWVPQDGEVMRLCSRGIAAARALTALESLLDTLKWLVPLVPKSRLDGDALEAIGGARFTGEELVSDLRNKVLTIETQLIQWSNAPADAAR